MRTGPSVECKGCGFPIALASAVREGEQRSLTCPLCSHAHVWAVVDVRRADAAGGSQRSLGSSVE